ncbi:ion transporter [Eisenibacter elegans]|jgi:voltage-gated potassium channel|uniref:ion transporter n=1 Tax=Eisenibacter elegans TaxID=997 RepID=UPI000409AE43|nr:ion transporter [Eisenibacter elegans]
MSPLKETLHEVIFGTETKAGQYFDVALLVFIVLSVVLVLLESMVEVYQSYRPALLVLEWTFSAFFLMEYALRIYCSPKPWRYVLSMWGVIDLLAVLPIFILIFTSGLQYLFSIRLLRLMRVFRILKLGQYFQAADHLKRAMVASSYKITVFLLSVFTLVTILGSLMYVVEGGKAGFDNIPTAIYWAIVTITTVGYGDIVPQTVLGKMIASLVMLLGYGIIAVPTGIITAEMNRDEHRYPPQEAVPCPKCHHPNLRRANFCMQCGTQIRQDANQLQLFD